MALKFSKASDRAVYPPVVVVYSAPGVGKTTVVSKLVDPKHPEKTLIVDLDGSGAVIDRICPEAFVATVENSMKMLRT
jgi:adenylate kinase